MRYLKKYKRAALAFLLAMLTVIPIFPSFAVTAAAEDPIASGWLTADSTATTAAVDTVDYTIEMDVLSLGGSVRALAIPFGTAKATANAAVMWQVQAKEDCYRLTTSYYDTSVNWLWTTVSDATVTFAQTTAEYAALEDGFHLKIHVTDTAIMTYIDGCLMQTVTTEQLGFKVGLGHMGLRTATGETGTVDNVVITDYHATKAGTILAAYNFSDTVPTGSKGTIANGVYTAPANMGIDYLADELTSAAPNAVDYTVDFDVLSLRQAYGFFFGNVQGTRGKDFLWQFRDTGSAYKLVPFHVGGFAAIDGAAVTFAEGADYTRLKTDGFHVQLHITDEIVWTLVDGVPISGISSRVLGYTPQLGHFGVRGADNEGAVLDNLEIVDYTVDPAGYVLAAYDFSKTVPTLPANSYTQDGTFVSPADQWVAGYPVTDLKAERFAVNYTLDVDILEVDQSLGVTFGAKLDNTQTIMWQIQDKKTYFQIVPYTGRSWKAFGAITLPAASYATMKENGFHMQLHVTDQWIRTYVDGTLLSTVSATTLGITPGLGIVGIRAADNEGGTLDNIKLVDYMESKAGKTLVDWNFSDKCPDPSKYHLVYSGYSVGTIADGVYYTGTKTAAEDVGNGYWTEFTFIDSIPNAESNIFKVNYAVDADILSIDFDSNNNSGHCISLMFGAAHASNSLIMHQLYDRGTYFELYPFTGTNWSAKSDCRVNFGESNYAAMKANGFHVRIHVTDLWVKTYIDNTLISTITAAQLGITPDIGMVGMRCATNEGGSIDNLVVTDYMKNRNGHVLVSYDFSDSVPTFKDYGGASYLGSVQNGVFTAAPANWMQGTFVENLKELAAAAVPDPLSLNYPHGHIYLLSKQEVAEGQKYVIEVVPDDGWQLKAGSLYALDPSGNTILPKRRDFRLMGDSCIYTLTVPANSTLHATFYSPDRDNANMAFLGTSYNTAAAGLRFVNRLALRTENDVTYARFDGREVAVTDYGMLVALSTVATGDALTLEAAADNSYIRQLSVKQANTYYDYCEDYIDISVCVTHIDQVENGSSLRIAARAYIQLADGTVLYTDTAVSSYEEAAYGVKTVSFTELVSTKKVIRLGRAGLVGKEWQMDWNNSGFEVEGKLSGNLELEVVNYRDNIALLNVIVDGGTPQVIEVPKGTSTVTLTSGLALATHTIQVISGSSIWTGNLSVTRLRYSGTLNKHAEDNTRLRILALGDSITCGWGLDGSWNGTGRDDIVRISNSYKTYAARTAQSLNAYLDVVARSSQVVSTIHGYVDKLNLRTGAPDWDWAHNQQDIVLINLGTNNELQDGHTAATTKADLKALMSDMREKNPNAYIILLYGMMCKDYESAYTEAVSELNTAGDDKMLILEFSPDTDGSNGHPDAAAHAVYAEQLTAFIRTNCTELFGHSTQTTDLAALNTAGTVLLNGRTSFSGTNLISNFANSGFTLSGYLYGDITLSVTADTNETWNPGDQLYYNVVIDGAVDKASLVAVKKGRATCTMVKNLRRGYHTVEITRGTAANYGTATLHELTYTGTLQKAVRKTLKMEFIGDSITNAEGTIVRNDLADNYYVERHNSLNSYAAQTARALNADLSVCAVSGISANGMLSRFGSQPAADEKDIVVINLGTNDMGWPYFDLEEMEEDGRLQQIRTDSAALIDLVRTTYGEDVQVIWAYGMMYEQGMTVLQEVIENYNTAHPTANVLFCNMFSVADTTGFQTHPSQAGQNAAATYLTEFIRTNCAGILSE